MKKMTLKRIASLLCVIVLVVGLIPAAFAAAFSVSDATWADVTEGYAAQNKTYTITNSSGAAIDYTASVGGVFTVDKASGNIAAGGTDTITVTFPAEKTKGTYESTLTVTAGGQTVTKAVKVNVKEPTYTLSLTPGSQWPTAALAGGAHEAKSVTYTIKNTGTGTVTGLRATVIGTGYSAGSLGKTTLAPNDSTTVAVTFAANQAANNNAYAGQLVINSDQNTAVASASFSVKVSAAKALSVSVKSGSWSSTDLVEGKYTANTVVYEIKNTGATKLEGLSVNIGNGTYFELNKSNVPTSLEAGQTATFTVTFPAGRPTGIYTGAVYVAATGASGTQIDLAQRVGSKVTVTFMSADYSNALAVKDVASGSTATYDAPVPYKAPDSVYSYTFVGWTMEENAKTSEGNVLGSGVIMAHDLSTMTFRNDTTLYAVFTKQRVSAHNIEVTCTSSSGATLAEMTTGTTGTPVYVQLYNAVVSGLGTGAYPGKVVFGNYNGSTYGNLYVDSSRAAAVGSTSFYFDISSYGSAPVANVFYAPSSAAGTFQIAYTAYDIYGNSVSGVLAIKSSASSTGDLSYKVAHNGTVTLSSVDFATYLYNKKPGSNLAYVMFTTPSVTLGANYGTFYYNYGKTGQVELGSAGMMNNMFYRTGNSYLIDNITFVPGSYTGDYEVSMAFAAFGITGTDYAIGNLTIRVTEGGDIEYTVDHNGSVNFKSADFHAVFSASYPTLTMTSVRFGTPSQTLGSYYGNIYYDYGSANQTALSATALSNYDFYSSVFGAGNYLSIDKLTFVPGTVATDYSISIPYVAYYDQTRFVSGTLVINVTNGADVNYTVAHNGKLTLNAADFEAYLKKTYPTGAMRWITFKNPSVTLGSVYGSVYYNYGSLTQVELTNITLQQYEFYASYAGYGDIPLSSLTFVPGTYNVDYTVSIPFTVYYNESYYVEGTLNIKVEDSSASGVDIVYNTKRGTAVSITAADLEKFFRESYPSAYLNYVIFGDVPATGDLYYKYGSRSSLGADASVKLTAANIKTSYFANYPTSAAAYSLHELTYVPVGAGYTVTIPFTAYYSESVYVTGTIAICVSEKSGNEAYMVTTKNKAVALAPSYINAEVNAATTQSISYIEFLNLPAETEGALYYDYKTAVSYNHKVSTDFQYAYSSGSYVISKISFVPATGFTGNVAIPYAAYNARGEMIYAGEMSIGVVNVKYSYSDVASTAWYYKYVTELSDPKIVSGYPDGTFKPSANVTYGEALKLILVTAGYGEQPRLSAKDNWASGYLAKAVSLGVYTSAEAAKLNLDAPITRLEVARVAATVMQLSSVSASSPFADTNNSSVIALYQAGIIEGSFNAAGLRYFNPTSNIQRAEISAIIWRMSNYS